MYQDEVKKYYDYTLNFYKVFWHGDTRAVHYGIWDPSTKHLHDALQNTNAFLAEAAAIKADDKVLDAGCGVGGSAFWLAQTRNARVTGITISEKQYAKAKELASRLGLEKQTEFYLQDYIKTDFPDASFDVVWALESVCHAVDKKSFLQEAYRLLKPGGRLIVGDGFLERAPNGRKEERKVKSFLRGWVLDNLAQPEEFKRAIAEVGFSKMESWDKTQDILPTARLMRRMCLWGWPLSSLTSFLKLTPKLLAYNNRAGIDQYYLFKNRVFTWRVFLAEK